MPTEPGDEGAADEPVKVVIDLAQHGSAWPGYRTERLWATRTGPTTARLDNHPFFARGYSYGDEVRFAPNAMGDLMVIGVVGRSGYCTIRLAPLDRADEFRDLEVQAGIRRDFEPLGVACEMAGPNLFNLVVLGVPPGCDIAEVRRRVVLGAEADRWDWEEGLVTAAWRALDDTDDPSPS